MSTLDEITQEKQRVSEALARIDAQRQKLAGQLGELEATERVLDAIAQARREPSRPSRPLHRPRQLLQRGGNAAASLLRPRNQVTVVVVAPRQPSAIRCLPWQPAERSTKSLPLVRGLALTMSARPSPGTSGQAASKSATGSYTQAKRQRRCNTQRSDSKARIIACAT